ncbi:hypothetical protein [uncultured Alsobacter sp.]|uniref:hypothetical protein n=1 Tax=uncultured Alsobacter sp. TaxID=1748258 RepID=UPI0025EBE851|nr:hypothetical protein [uncultured Alsobacter sp.]
MSKARAIGCALLLFVGMAGSMVGMGTLVFEETTHLALYSVGVVSGATWLALGTYRTEVAAQADRRDPPQA